MTQQIPVLCMTCTVINIHGAHGGAVLRGKLLSTRYSRQLLTTEDGGTIGLDWFRGCDAPGVLPPAAPVLLVLHGLTGMPTWHVGAS